MSKTKRYLSILLCLVLLCTTLIPMYAFAADDTLQILCDGVIVSGNDKTPMHIKETEQKQLSVLFNGSETLPEGTQVRCLHRRRISRMWMKTALSQGATAPRAQSCAFGWIPISPPCGSSAGPCRYGLRLVRRV